MDMDVVLSYRRKVYKVSKDSWVVTVPPEWVRNVLLRRSGSNEVELSVLADGSILIRPAGIRKADVSNEGI